MSPFQTEIEDWAAEAQGSGASLWCSYDISNGTYGVPCTGVCQAFNASLAFFLLGMEQHSYFGGEPAKSLRGVSPESVQLIRRRVSHSLGRLLGLADRRVALAP